MQINLYPKTCNICGGKVIYTTNDVIYGKQYGSGYCYLCTKCRAYVGTHFPHPKQAFGILADEQMRKGKQMCHELFDSLWKGKKKAQSKRDRLYLFLSYELGIPHEQTHFGYFDLPMLRKAYKVLKRWQKNGIDWTGYKKDKDGKVMFKCPNKDWGDVDNIGCWETCELYERGECDNGFVSKELFAEEQDDDKTK